MHRIRITLKVLSVITLLFANFSSTPAQIGTDTSGNQLPAGTKIVVKMDNEINSGVSAVGDTFTAIVSEPVKVRDVVMLPIGTVIVGRVTKVKRAAVGKVDGNLSLAFETLRLSTGEERKIEGVLVDALTAQKSNTSGVLAIIGGTAIGGLIGAVSKADNGALIGAGIGLGGGTAVALLRKGKEVRITADERFEIEITKAVNLPVVDF